MISYLLSKSFLDHSYTRIWPPSTDDFSYAQRREIEEAMIDETKTVSEDILSLLLKVYFIQDSNQDIESLTWLETKQHISFKLSARRLYSSLFRDQADDGTTYTSINEVVLKSLLTFNRVDVQQSCLASVGRFPKETTLQHMFFKGLVSSLPATTEVVSEMSAILPDRGDRRKCELDFYVNSGYYFGIELMRDGNNFREHVERFLEPFPSQPARSCRGKYFSPLVKDFRILDFRKAGFKARNKDAFRLVAVFEADYGGCQVWWQGKKIFSITFGSTTQRKPDE